MTSGSLIHDSPELSRPGALAFMAACGRTLDVTACLGRSSATNRTGRESKKSNQANKAAVFNDPITQSIIGKISGVRRWITRTDDAIPA